MSLRFDSIARRPLVMRRPFARCVAVALVLVAAGCAPDAAVAPPPLDNDPNMYWSLTLDHHAITMSTVAPYDTIRLTATPRNTDGTPIPGLPAPTFTSLDLDRVQVSADGLVHVIGSGVHIPVMVTLAVGNLRHTDMAYINVTDLADPPVLDTFSIHPAPPDSAKTALFHWKSIVPRATTADGTEITGLAVHYTVSDATTAMIGDLGTAGQIEPVRAGQVTVIASATAYGVTKADTVTYTIGNPISAEIDVTAQKNANGQTVDGFTPNQLLLGPGATVLILNPTGVATDLTFDDPTNVAADSTWCQPFYTNLNPHLCEGGNLAAWAREPSDSLGITMLRVRRFPVPGTYTYHSTIFGTSGTIVVADESSPTP